MISVVTASEMRALEAAAFATGISYDAMMQRAGASVAAELENRLSVAGQRVVVLAGPGNNGGDGLVAARRLRLAGAETAVILSRARDVDDPLVSAYLESGGALSVWDRDIAHAAALSTLADAHIVVDALLGTGASRPVSGNVGDMLSCLNQSREPGRRPGQILASVDLPSGLDADTGAVDSLTPHADLTVTFGFPKRGHFAFPGAACTGELVTSDIGLPPNLPVHPAATLLDAETVRSLLPRRPPDANKGTSGRAVIVAGCLQYPGAPILAARAAARAGVGLVTLACAASLVPGCAAASPETTFSPLPEDPPGRLGEGAVASALEAATRSTATLIGCGLGRHSSTDKFVRTVVAALRCPYVVDADGLNALAELPDWWTILGPGGVLTPHPGEMARLAGVSVEEVQGDRFGVASLCAARWGQVVVLKGAYTLVAAPDGRISVNPFANPALATAGTGDVLAGILVGLLARGMTPMDAAIAATYLHASAAELACGQYGGHGLIAGDLIPQLPAALVAVTGG